MSWDIAMEELIATATGDYSMSNPFGSAAGSAALFYKAQYGTAIVESGVVVGPPSQLGKSFD
ncbi:hypothetical protein MGN70_010717 [Eutypa lata]|nr:hypothetical protein MGN70_010717 [Eutypa lata]